MREDERCAEIPVQRRSEAHVTHELVRIRSCLDDCHSRVSDLESQWHGDLDRASEGREHHSAEVRSATRAGSWSSGTRRAPVRIGTPKSSEAYEGPRKLSVLGSVTRPANIDQKRIINKDLLASIYDKPYKQARHQGSVFGGGVLGLLSMPFGPIGMAAGGMFGALVGGGIGFVIDIRTMKQRIHEQQLEKRRLKSLVRWAGERFHDDEETLKLVEMVTLQFKPAADIAEGSESARKMLKLLEKWISQKNVARMLWIYMDQLLQGWKDLNRADFITSMRVFHTLTIMYNYSTRNIGEQEAQFLKRMEALLSHKSVQLIMSHARMYPTEGETRVMECLVYTDASRDYRKGGGVALREPSPSSTPRTCPSESSDEMPDEERNDPMSSTATSTHGILSPVAHDVEDASAKEPHMVLKKPFFKGWEDFMEFDISIKHQMSITLSEFDLLLLKKEETLKGWDLCVDKNEIKVAKQQTDLGVITVRGWATVQGVDAHAAFFLFYEISERLNWDKVFGMMKIVEVTKEGSDILYSLLKVPSYASSVAARDFLQFRRVCVLEDGSILIVLRSADHVDAPPDKRYVRAESYISGYVLKQTEVGGKPALDLFLMSCTDIKGLVPKWIINHMAPKKAVEWVENIRTAGLEYQRTHTNYKDECFKFVQRFTGANPWDYEPEENGILDSLTSQSQTCQE